MKNVIKTFLVIGVLLIASSCTKDLELSPTSSITSNSFWNTPSQAKAGVLSMWRWFRPQAASNLFIWGGARAGLLTYGLQASQGFERYFLNTVNPDNAGPGWLRLYTTIYAANLAIAKIPKIEFNNESLKNRLLARAYTMRAFVYFVMARTWGGVPLVTEPVTGFPSNTGKPRAPVEKIFKQIKSDINKAVNLFPDNSFPDCRCKWSKPAALALKGNIYLWTGKLMGGGKADLQTALGALQKVKNANVTLLDNYDDIFRYDNKGNREIIMAVHFQDLESGSMYNNLMFIRGDQIPDHMNQKAENLLGLGGGLNRWGPSKHLMKQFSDDDSRKDATFLAIYKKTNNGQDSTFYASIVRKFRGYTKNGQRKFLDDVILYRYGGVLLMLAEAKNALGMDPTPEMKKIRKRAYGDNYSDHKFVSTTQKANKKAILQERLRELAFEGKRWWALIRFGKAFDLIPSLQNRQGQDYLLLWPISRSILSLNNKLEQNPGYQQ